MEAFAVSGLTFRYPGREAAALDDIGLTVAEGEFITICGKSGCGKSTLLRHLKPSLTPHGERSGQILFRGAPIAEMDQREQAAQIGFVMQNPDSQIVTDKVWHELAFGLESLGTPPQTIRLRVAEMASFFGIESWFHRDVAALSGGQKQLLNLASIMAMQPAALILDEPTSQLDPIAASDFLQTVRKINRELGTTILITEHRLEDVFPSSDRVVVMDDGKILAESAPAQVGERLKTLGHDMFASMPAAMQVYAEVESDLSCPVTVREGRAWLSALAGERELTHTGIPVAQAAPAHRETPAVEIREAWFRYEREGGDVIQDLSLQIRSGEIHCIVGGNGVGKTTALGLISGQNRPYRGKVLLRGRDIRSYRAGELFGGLLGALPQNPGSLFVKKTVELDLREMPVPHAEKDQRLARVVRQMGIGHLLHAHPYDLSGGEQQRAALAKILMMQPEIILLDEPTKGLDNHFKNSLGEILVNLRDDGATIIIVSHDVEFCARFADRCTMFFNGTALATDLPYPFFSGNSFYTTSANRMSRHLFRNAITPEDVIELCKRNQLSHRPKTEPLLPAESPLAV